MANLNVLPQVQPAKVEATPLSEMKEKSVQAEAAQKEFEKELATAAQADGTLLAMIQPQTIAQKPEPVSIIKSSAEESITAENGVVAPKANPKEELPVKPLNSETIAPQIPQNSQPHAQVNSSKQEVTSKKDEVKQATKKTLEGQSPAQSQAINAKIPALQSTAIRTNLKAKSVTSTEGAAQGVSTESLPLQNELNVQNLEVKNPAESNPSQPQAKKPVQKNHASEPLAPSPAKSALPSTDEYLSLRNSLKRARTEGSVAAEGPTEPARHALTIAQPASLMAPIVDAHTTQGTQGKTVLSHDAIDRLTHHVSLFTQAKQDGEIKIRLKPDHLGELQMSVRAQGQQVSIQIKTANGEAKRIIEESMSSLRDSLSQQNLNLSQVDVVTQPNASHASSNDAFQSMDSQKQQQQHNAFEQQQQSREERFSGERPEPRRPNVSQIASRTKPVNASATGLDLIA